MYAVIKGRVCDENENNKMEVYLIWIMFTSRLPLVRMHNVCWIREHTVMQISTKHVQTFINLTYFYYHESNI